MRVVRAIARVAVVVVFFAPLAFMVSGSLRRIGAPPPDGFGAYSLTYLGVDLAGQVSYEEVVHLLFYGRLPNAEELASLTGSTATALEADPAAFERSPPTIDPLLRAYAEGRPLEAVVTPEIYDQSS